MKTQDTTLATPDRQYWSLAVLASVPIVALAWTRWSTATFGERILRDAIVYGALSVGLAAGYDGSLREELGWTLDRETAIAAVGLTVFVLPFYVVGASLPAVRNAYPMWGVTLEFPGYLVHALGLLVLTVVAETYFRGLLCVGLRHLGPAAIVVHVPVYVLVHVPRPTIEMALSAGVGLLFGWVAYRTRSIFPVVVAHFVGLVVLDVMVSLPPLFPDAHAYLPV